jgi:hypothetical protein
LRITVTYDRVKHPVRKSGECPVCKKKVTRSTTFEATINPFNRNENGQPRTEAEIRQILRRDAERWQPNFTHEKCKE